MTAGLIISGISIISFLGVFTIASQTVKAAFADPVKSLRYE